MHSVASVRLAWLDTTAATPTNPLGVCQVLASILKKPGVRKKPYLVRGRDEALTAARHITTDSLAPIFLTSAVTGAGAAAARMRAPQSANAHHRACALLCALQPAGYPVHAPTGSCP